MEIKRLGYFLTVAELGSISRAAAVIGIAQPALGRQIRKLEHDCGCRLFHRHGRGVALTDEGVRYAERLRPLMRQLSAASEDLGTSPGLVQGAVVLGLTPSLVEWIGVALITAIERKFPALKLTVLSSYNGYLHEWLLDGRLDLAVLQDTRRSQHVLVGALAKAQVFLVSSPATPHLAALKADTISFEGLADLPLVLTTRGHGLRNDIEQVARARGIELSVRYEVDSLTLMKRLAAQGLAHAMITLPTIQSEVARGELVARRIVRPQLTTHMVLACPQNRPLSAAGRAVLAEVREVLGCVVQASPVPLYVELASAQFPLAESEFA